MIYSIDMDDFRGHCGSGKYPLLKAVRQELTADNYQVQFVYDGPYERSAASLITGKAKSKDRKQPSFENKFITYSFCACSSSK